jgi:beta-phosphoglucomutase
MQKYIGLEKMCIDDFEPIKSTNCKGFRVDENGVVEIFKARDSSAELVCFKNKKTLAIIKSKLMTPVYYPLTTTFIEKPIKYILMDLDGTTIKSEKFWIEIIRKSIASLTNNLSFSFDEHDIPHISGHSVSEHLGYCISKYCSEKHLEDAKRWYQFHVKNELELFASGKGNVDIFEANEGLKDFLLEAKRKNIKIALVSSGVFEKVLPSIEFVFKKIELPNPLEFYDCIITAGNTVKKGVLGTLGELSAKPHPWLYSEAFYVGLGLTKDDLKHTIGIEDSSAGIYALKLAGISPIGISGGNIKESGSLSICDNYFSNLKEISDYYL